MYSTCLFCKKTLGTNETFDSFPVGKRLAFDAAKGRLWVICRRCERWNLSPLDERWETIELAERVYSDTKARVTTDNIGMARLADGMELIRIGEPRRPEFAAWRYGDQFGRRRRRNLLLTGGAVVGVGALVVGGLYAGVVIGGTGFFGRELFRIITHGSPDRVVATIQTEDRGLIQVRRRHLAETTIDRASDGSLALELAFEDGRYRQDNRRSFEGAEAERIASIVMPQVNRFGGSKGTVRDAVAQIDERGSSEKFLDDLPSFARVVTRMDAPARTRIFARPASHSKAHLLESGLYALPAAHRLAFEMALHEESERRALNGELAALEAAWRDAEEIAAISDSLLIAPDVDAEFDRLREKS
jgi:hypothetical protein